MNSADRDAVQTLNRRRHYRVNCDLPLRFQMHGERGDSEGTARMTNIGLGGARVDFPEAVTRPSEVILTLEIGSGIESLELPARVVWTVADHDGGPYPTGLQFRDLEDAARRRLYDIIGSLMR